MNFIVWLKLYRKFQEHYRIFQLFLQHEQQTRQRIQSAKQHSVQTIYALETELSLYELQVKATQDELDRFRRKAVQILLKFYPVSAGLFRVKK